MKRKFIVPLLMPRRDYDVATILYDNNQLERLVIDAYYNKERYKIFNVLDRMVKKKSQIVYNKYSPKILPELIHSSWLIALKFRYDIKKNNTQYFYKEQIKAYKLLNSIASRYVDLHRDVFIFGWDTASVEIFSYAKKAKSSLLILEQCVAPRAYQLKMYQNFINQGLITDNFDTIYSHCEALQKREEIEWDLADRIIVPSLYVKDTIYSIIKEDKKLHYLPYGYDPILSEAELINHLDLKFSNLQSKRTVLFVGNASLRKGLHDVLRIASFFVKDDIEFRIAGHLDSSIIFGEKPINVTFLGKLERDDLNYEYLQADIFLFPSYLEGSALVIYEAMSWGLPVITTYESGSIIESGKEGYVVDAGDCSTIIQNITQLLMNNNLRYFFSLASYQKLIKNNLESYKEGLLRIINL